MSLTTSNFGHLVILILGDWDMAGRLILLKLIHFMLALFMAVAKVTWQLLQKMHSKRFIHTTSIAEKQAIESFSTLRRGTKSTSRPTELKMVR